MSARERRVSLAVVALATAFFVLAASWELFGPHLAGHYASSASMGIIADNMLSWGIAGPVWEYTERRPDPSLYYCHHPWGIFWTTAAFMKVFGRHDFVCRLPAVLLSGLTPPLLFLLGRALWRPAAGAAAALAFVVLPISLAFSNFNALEVPTMAYGLLFLWGYARLVRTGRRRYLAASLSGALAAMHADWPGYLLVGSVLAFELLRAHVLPRRAFSPAAEEPGASLSQARGFRRRSAFFAFGVSLAALSLAFYVAAFHRAGKLADLLASYGLRSSGGEAPLSAVLASRRYWIELSFTPLAVAIGKAGALASLLRLLVLRRELEFLPLAFLGTATFQYVVFKQGADVHVFWPHYFAVSFALGTGALVATLASWLPGARPAFREAAPLVALALAALAALAVLRDGLPALAYARKTGGRWNEKGNFIQSDGEKTDALAWLSARIPEDARVGLHESMRATWSQVWTLGGRVVRVGAPPPGRPGDEGSIFVADARFAPEPLLVGLARRFRVRALGSVWVVDAGEAPGPLEAFSFEEREPSPLEFYLRRGTEPLRRVVPDAYATWELRHHLGEPSPPPVEPPVTLEQRRVAHNAALAFGDEARAASLGEEVASAFSMRRAELDPSLELLGTRFEEGVRPTLTLLVRARGPAPPGAALSIVSRVTRPPPLSTTMADPTPREVALPPAIPPSAHRPGFLYAFRVPIVKRPGSESFFLRFGPPRRGAEGLEVLELR